MVMGVAAALSFWFEALAMGHNDAKWGAWIATMVWTPISLLKPWLDRKKTDNNG